MSKALYISYYRVNKETGEKEYLQTNMFSRPPYQWLKSKEHADKYSSYDSFINNANSMNLEEDINQDKYVYDFEEVK